MSRTASIVAYHYVRNLEESRYPRIKGRRVDEFVKQVRMFAEQYNPITVEQLVAAVRDPAVDLPDDAVLLTFDDGYIDHYANAAPVLAELGIAGAFFVPVVPVLERRVLQVNKIHFVLAAIADEDVLLQTFFAQLRDRRQGNELPSDEELFARFSEPNRYDSGTITFIKRMLQKVLPVEIRQAVVDQLFERFVSEDEAAFADELYMDLDQVEQLRRSGMHVGAHGYSHSWMDTLPPDEQDLEVDRSQQFLAASGGADGAWTMSYPYGASNESLTDILAERRCGAAFTMQPRVADLDLDPPLRLPRLDTNDFRF